VVTGEIRIGDGVTIASGTILSRSVPDHSLVAGNPGRVALAAYDNRPLFAQAAPASAHRAPAVASAEGA
jgi:serine O-acetyltransferase